MVDNPNRSRVEHLTIESAALRGNRLGDPHVRDVAVYLPPGYDDPARADQRYPVVLMLASHGNTGQGLLGWRPWGESLDQQLDRLILSGACPPHLMVMPDTWTSFGGGYLNCPAFGNCADFVLDEVLPLVDARLRTLADGRHRAVMGRSSGGHAAIYHAMTRPGLFAAVADHSGDAYFEFMAMPAIARMQRGLARFGGLDGFIAESKTTNPKDQAFFDVASLLTFAAMFAPNADTPHGFDLPIDPQTGALDETVWARCLEFDPVRMAAQAQYADALRNLKELFIDCGAYDEYNLQVGARLLSGQLTRLGVPHTYEEFPGGHRGTHYRYDVSLPRLVRALVG